MSSAVMYSGGACSHLAAKRWVELGHKPILLFSDTGIEDEDLYRFIEDGAQWLGCELVKVSAGFTFDEMCEKHHAIPNDRMPFCSRELKVLPAKKWIAEHPEIDTLVFGLDWTETHRLPKVEKLWPDHKVVAPMMDAPYLMKASMVQEIGNDGLKPPALYGLGLSHNNCGGGCVRNGHASWKLLRMMYPARFEEWADREERLGRGFTFSRDRRGGESKPISLRDLVITETPPFDFGGCGCFVDEEVPQ